MYNFNKLLFVFKETKSVPFGWNALFAMQYTLLPFFQNLF